MKKHEIGAYMTPHVITIGGEQDLKQAKEVMHNQGFRHLPVLKGGQLIGVISDRDIKLAFAIDGEKAAGSKVFDACSGDVYSAQSTESIKNVACGKSGIKKGGKG